MIKIPSIIDIKPESKIVSINEFFRDIFKLIDIKFKHIDIYPWQNSKTFCCKHKKSCIHNCLMGFIKGFFKCYAFQTILNLIYFIFGLLSKKVM